MHKDEITLSVTSFNKTTAITQPDDVDIHEFLESCRSLAIAAGYHENNWKDAVVEMANEYLMEEENEVERNMRNYGNYTKENTQKVYTGKSDLITHWGPLSEQKPTKEYTDWIKKNIPDSNC